MTNVELAVRYVAFALCAMAVNIGVQYLCMDLYRGPASLYVALFFGTAAGTPLKYTLDKRWIFYHPATGLKEHGKRFTLYVLAGVLTTAMFWVTEIVFDRLFALWYVGAAIGLAAGYLTKYQLDKRFAFANHG